MSYEILNSVNYPADLKNLDKKQTEALCGEIREFLIENVSKTGGHLASNLGIVETTVAIHKVFDCPEDHVIFDVGHQSYVHKILTGRKDRFGDLRKPGGLSGFTNRRESEYDCFGAGHSSTAISAALGFAEADRLSGKSSHSICVVGDGAFTGGMVHEALNNCRSDMKLIIILNENRMSISKNRGAFASHLAKVRVSQEYLNLKKGTNSVLSKIPLIGKAALSVINFFRKKVKKIYLNNYFEDLGLYYLGPVDGNNYADMERVLREAKRLNKCVVVHAYTKKGKGYVPAEKNPAAFHGIGAVGKKAAEAYHEAFSEDIVRIAEGDDKVLAVTAAMGIGTGLDIFEKTYPKRYFDVGIAEEHALTFAAGLAASGYKPFVAIYSTFLQRGYDNILHDIALQKLPVKIMIDRAGLATADGATHHGIFDVAFLSQIPGVSIYAPSCFKTLSKMVDLASEADSAVAIRYPNAGECPKVLDAFYSDGNFDNFTVRGDFETGAENDILFVTYGNIVSKVIAAKERLSGDGVKAGIVLAEQLKPQGDVVSFIKKNLGSARAVLFVEEGIKNGGFSMICADELRKLGVSAKIDIAAIDDNFASPTVKCDLYDFVGLSAEAIYNRAITLLGE